MKKTDSILWHITDETIEKIFGDVRKKHSSREEFNELLSKVNLICPGLQKLHKFTVASMIANDDKALAQCGIVLSSLLEIYHIEESLRLERELS